MRFVLFWYEHDLVPGVVIRYLTPDGHPRVMTVRKVEATNSEIVIRGKDLATEKPRDTTAGSITHVLVQENNEIAISKE